MHIILGGTGHIGSALAQTLADMGEPVTIVTRDPSKGQSLPPKGVKTAVADVHDMDALRRVFRQGKRLFLLNPPAPPSTDTDTAERNSLAAILSALAESGLEKIVAASTYGAQSGQKIGDLGILHEMEKALEAQPIPATVIRSAYYMSNWDVSLKTAQEEGIIHTFFPVGFALPMVAPRDVGQIAARLMTQPVGKTGLHFIEGPERYSSSDVAAAFAAALQRRIEAVAAPRAKWMQAYKTLGFSDAAARSHAGMTGLTLDQPAWPDAFERGSTSLENYVAGLVQAASPA